MNISLKNQCIWLSPERTAGKKIQLFFKNFDFYSCTSKNKFELKSFDDFPHSKDVLIPDEYKSFRVISSIRNPYDRIWSCFVNFYVKNFIQRNFEENKLKFNEFIHNSFKKTFVGVQTDKFFNGNDYINKWKFDELVPNQVIRTENLIEDLKNIDFVKNSSFEPEDFISDDIKMKSTNLIKYNTVYEIESAKIVFHFYKNHFYSFNYDPFSFTNKILSDEQKIDFIHSL